MNWHEIAIELSKRGMNCGDITRELMKLHLFGEEDFYPCYERVRKYIRKHRTGNIVQNLIPMVVNHSDGDKVIKFGLIGDTHIGSKYDRLDKLEEFYAECKKEGCTKVYHCGDISDGYGMRPGQQFEIYTNGAEEVIQNIVKNYPRAEGIKTYFITGNHDASIYKSCGIDIGKYIDLQREDMEYLGKDRVLVKLTDNITMEMRHPWDGSAYAISQKPQKIIDNMWKDRPNILAIGHYHKAEYLYYKGVHAFQVGCFQDTTPFETGKNIIPAEGGWIIELCITDTGSIKFITPKFFSF